jgi:hypothetical protein
MPQSGIGLSLHHARYHDVDLDNAEFETVRLLLQGGILIRA